jgi:hypothetical protein
VADEPPQIFALVARTVGRSKTTTFWHLCLLETFLSSWAPLAVLRTIHRKFPSRSDLPRPASPHRRGAEDYHDQDSGDKKKKTRPPAAAASFS